MKVITNKYYKYEAQGLDIWDARTSLKNGDVVQVKKLNGCPSPNIMGHCHVYKDGHFAGLVLTASLNKI